MSALDNRIPPPVIAALIAAGMWALAHWWPLMRFDLPFPVLTGLAVAAVGGLVSGAGAREFKRVRTTVNPLHPDRASSLVTTGIYRFTRNPMYVGISLVLLGCFFAFGGVSAAMGLPAFIGYIGRFQIAPEEQALQARFGAEYTTYLARVPRWL